MTDPSSPLDRSSLERVLARAAELQSGAGETGEEFTEEQLLELGSEVGLSAQNLRQALAEERTRSISPDEEHGVIASVFGPSRVRAARTVPGKAADVLASVDAWMQRQELLIVKRHHADRIVWEPRRDFLVGLKRAFKVGGRDYALSHAFEVSATVMAVDESRSQVGLDADFRTNRSRAAQQTAVSSLVGAGATASLFVMGVTAAVAAAPVLIVRNCRSASLSGATHNQSPARARAAARSAGACGLWEARGGNVAWSHCRGGDGDTAATFLTPFRVQLAELSPDPEPAIAVFAAPAQRVAPLRDCSALQRRS